MMPMVQRTNVAAKKKVRTKRAAAVMKAKAAKKRIRMMLTMILVVGMMSVLNTLVKSK